MELVKKNLTSIICGVVAIVAVVAAFFPLGGYFEELKTKVGQSTSDLNTINGLKSQTFTKPLVDPFSTEAPPLEVFPTTPVIEEGKKAVETMASKSQLILQKATQFNKRVPLVRAVLPAPQSESYSDVGLFKRRYWEKQQEWLQAMNAVLPPQQNEMQAAQDALWLSDFANRISVVNGVETNRQAIELEFQRRKLVLPDEIKAERARRGSMYYTQQQRGTRAYPKVFDDIPRMPLMEKNDLPDLTDIWQAQLAIWIQDDIVQAIVDTNSRFGRKEAGAAMPNVEGAVVKRIASIQIPKFYITKNGKTPIAIPRNLNIPDNMKLQPEEPGQFKPFYGNGVTGRISNSLYDVVQFNLQVDVD